MKNRWIALALLLAMVLTLAACGQPATTEPESKWTEEELAAEIDFPNVPETIASKMEIDIYLLAGQSNAAGWSAISNAEEGKRDENTYENVRYYSVDTLTDGTEPYSTRAYGPVHEGLGYDAEHLGPELGMARALNDRYATNERKAIIVKVANSGTTLLANEADGQRNYSNATWERFLTYGSWYPQALQTDGNTDPSRPTGYLTRLLCATMKEVFDDLVSRGFAPENIHFKALCWMQGETDHSSGRKYAEVFPLFAEEVRASLSETTGVDYTALPIVLGEISETFASASPDYVQTNKKFIESQHKLAENDATITVIPTGQFQINAIIDGVNTALGTDNAHWSYADILSVGEMFGNTAYDVSH